ncbi:MAG: EMC3/TMCO1 family protein [Candidatus Asgardarchaeia archaeon]
MQDIFGWWNDFLAYFQGLLTPVKYPPYSTIFVFAVASAVVILSTVLTYLFVDVRKLQRYQKEISEFNKLRFKALRSGDERLLAKVKRLQPAINRKQTELLSMRMRPMTVTLIPLLLLFAILNGLYYGIPVAYIPLDLSALIPIIGGWLGVKTESGLFGIWFVHYYLLVALSVGNIINKISGLAPTS